MLPRSASSNATVSAGSDSPPTWARWYSAATACEAPLVTRKLIKSSNGQVQTRYVVRTLLALGSHVWPVEFTLTCRKTMRYRLLLGSKALVEGQWLIDPSRTYIQDKPQILTSSGAP